MRKSLVVAISLSVLLASFVYAQGTYLPLVAGGGDAISAAAVGEVLTCTILSQDGNSMTLECISNATPIPPTDTPIDTETPTPVPPTDTPTNTPAPPTDTPVPPTPTPAGTIAPFAAAPLCSTHDPTAYHSLWDSVQGCHYNHTHNADPYDPAAVALFGQPATWGQTISYPWETMSGAGTENHVKHEGYKWLVETGLPLVDKSLNWSPQGQNNWVTDVRLEHHRLGGPADLTVRLHSFYQEVRICRDTAKTQCGIVKFGGWTDYGILESPYKQQRLLLPAQDGPYPASRDLNVDPYRSALPFAEAVDVAADPSANCRTCGLNGGSIKSLWTSSPYGLDGYNQIGGVFTVVFDDFQGIDRADPGRLQPVCSGCRFNSTEHELFTAWVNVPGSLDAQDGATDGYVTYAGYTDKRGNIVSGCTAPGADCVPLVFDHAPVGMAGWNTPTDNGKDANRWRDYDISPDPVWWIQYPN